MPSVSVAALILLRTGIIVLLLILDLLRFYSGVATIHFKIQDSLGIVVIEHPCVDRAYLVL
jgi:hypothetical protein